MTARGEQTEATRSLDQLAEAADSRKVDEWPEWLLALPDPSEPLPTPLAIQKLRSDMDKMKVLGAENPEQPSTHLRLNSGKFRIPTWSTELDFRDLYGRALGVMQDYLRREEIRLRYWLEQQRHSSVPAERERVVDRGDALYQGHMAKAIHDVEEPFFVVERRTEVFPYYMDFDFQEALPEGADDAALARTLPEELMLEYARAVQDVLRRFWPELEPHDEVFQCVLAVSNKPKRLAASSSTPDCVKYGIHLHAPRLLLTSAQALDIRLSVIAALEQRRGARPSFNPWEQVVDATVYVGSGLRMLYSYKAVKCDGPQHRANPELCACRGNRGKKIERRFYEPHCALAADGSVDAAETQRLRAEPVYAVRRLSIRTDDETRVTAGYAVPLHAPRQPPEQKLPAAVRRANAELRAQEENWQEQGENPAFPRGTQVTEAEAKRLNAIKGKVEVDRSLDSCQALQAKVQRVFGEYYPALKNVYFSRVWRVDASKPYLICKAAGSGAHYCINKGDEHESSTTWFYVSREKKLGATVRQKCFSKKQLVRPNGGVECSEFRSREYATLDAYDADQLLGAEASRGRGGPQRAPGATAKTAVSKCEFTGIKLKSASHPLLVHPPKRQRLQPLDKQPSPEAPRQ